MRYVYFLIFMFCHQTVYAQALEPKSITQGEMTRVIVGLVLVLVFIVLLSWFLKRFNGFGLALDSKGFKAIGGMSLTPKERVVLIQAGERYLLLGVASGSITTLADFGEKLPAGFNGQNKQTFSDVLKSALGKS